ncbi:MAG TPA: ATP-binding cassette domain-containing protein [Candidatus Paceibacterota bacterium]|nr:ATP-binding cassette domain-containing protein [Candidatus Paceibacterota bacterium]
MLQASNITKRFGDKVVLDNVSLTVNPGTITSIIGPSGSGKTTLLKTIGMLELAELGKVVIDDMSYQFPTSIEGREPWPKVTIVFQQLFIWPHLTLKQNILLPLGESVSNEQQKQLNELIETFDMHEFINRYPNEVSIGQRQRAAIVRALMLNPKYLLLDEVTSSLDVEQISSILSHLGEIKKRGVAVVLVTHLLNFAKSVSDQVIFLENGKIVVSGPRDILENSSNERLRQFTSLIEQAS